MSLQRLLQITIAALAAMGTMLLGMGQREIGMTLLMILAAGFSVWLTDIKGWVYLNRNLANLIMLGAALFSMRGLIHLYSEYQALNFAQLLIYLQIILLFQKKDSRIYWLLIMLSLLQVVVAALFSQGVFFGILLIAYMVLASLSLTLLMLNRQGESVRSKSEMKSPAKEKTPAASPVSRWPMIDRQPDFDGSETVSSRQGVVGELFRRLFGISVRTLGLTMALFILVPRFGQVGWRGGITPPKATVGFNDQVTLGELGQIIESPSEVMRVRFFKGDTENSYSTNGEIYLYGGLLMDYEKGRWRAGTPSDCSITEGKYFERLRGQKLPKGFVTQKCDIEGLDHNELFFVEPAIPLDFNNTSVIDDEKMCRLNRHDDTRTRKFLYHMGTTAFLDGIQSPLSPKKELEIIPFATRYPKDKNGEPALKQLKKLTDDWIAESKLPPEDVLGQARFLERKLSESGLFKYSLQGQTRDQSMDPIEDFLIVHRAGHCEYFATALTLMLRHADIPARMVVGFKCDEWHETEQCYQVRQLHAHTWVQAYLKYDQLPKKWLHGEDYFSWKRGGWIRLDPTPAGGDESKNSFFAPIEKGMQWLDFVWSYYVVELNYERQRKAIFTPIAEAATVAAKFLFDPKTWRTFYERIGDALHRSGAAGAVAWLLLILAVAAALALIGLIGYLFWRLGRKLRRFVAAKRARRRRGPRIEVEFYRRLEHLLAKNGLARPLGQTPREFAGMAGEWLAAQTGENRLSPLPARVVDAYYRVRFGRISLDNLQTQEVEQILKDVESQIANRKLRQGKRG